MHSLRDDLFYLRLKQLAWQQYTQEMYVHRRRRSWPLLLTVVCSCACHGACFVPSCSEKNPDIPHSRVIKSFLDTQQRRDVRARRSVASSSVDAHLSPHYCCCCFSVRC